MGNLYKNHAMVVRAAAAYEHAFPDDESKRFWNADGSLNKSNSADKDYHLPTENELRAEGIDGYEGLRRLLYHPVDPRNGKPTDLVGALYILNDAKDEATPVSIVHKGTDPTNLHQIQEDILQNIGIKLSQTTWAKSGHMMFNGNSLGGGLAIVSSRVSGVPAYVTNSAAVNDMTYVYKKGDSSINAIYVNGEFLHYLQTALFYATAFGHLPIEGGGDIITNPIQNNFSNGMTVDLINPAKEDRSIFPNPLFHAGSRGGLLSS